MKTQRRRPLLSVRVNYELHEMFRFGSTKVIGLPAGARDGPTDIMSNTYIIHLYDRPVEGFEF